MTPDNGIECSGIPTIRQHHRQNKYDAVIYKNQVIDLQSSNEGLTIILNYKKQPLLATIEEKTKTTSSFAATNGNTLAI